MLLGSLNLCEGYECVPTLLSARAGGQKKERRRPASMMIRNRWGCGGGGHHVSFTATSQLNLVVLVFGASLHHMIYDTDTFSGCMRFEYYN